MDLTFNELNAVNVERCKRWHEGFPSDENWTGADWSNAMVGEAGEAANVVKKLRREQFGHAGVLDKPRWELIEALGKELADTIIYADLLATYYGIDLPAAIRAKFNEVSELQGFPERLEGLPDDASMASSTRLLDRWRLGNTVPLKGLAAACRIVLRHATSLD